MNTNTSILKIAALFWPMLVSFTVVAVTGPFLIPFLRKIKAGQTERDDGPKSHLSKTGTPNMGGLMILLALVLTGVFWATVRHCSEIFPVLILTVGFGAVGFADDYIKVVLKRSKGLSIRQKMICQIGFALLFAWYASTIHHIPFAMIIPFGGGRTVDLGFFNIPVLLFIAVATVNGTNFTDGVDGLASSVTAIVAAFFTLVASFVGSNVAPLGAAMIGALMGFLLFNAHPAKVFMGDTGSLALGGFVTGMAYMLQIPLFIPIVGFIYFIEVVSVIIQIVYFRKTHGKRFFKMAPIHHHFELSGWSETKVVAVFTIVTVLLCGLSFIALR